ncbi:helicase-exonuclease AddAB subunit AddB [Asaccharospora irregularis]|uniref:ATP-dependent helicase/deoxyribonuclease subunit B n=1 Tax=Asaccharospora irregularis DSM 2635 TaxID=1121321 RepID=A0A1M5RV48_9FIRM|nr:helicase-exonuclease AddAB subunit AddB [Asaccharospora irregularis]SHH30202.1 DNA helicase/exodeoxyribonuclease V, subunit B [Asaccharospora irregularis DSM 2635]
MGLRFILGRGGSGKSTYILDEIKKNVKSEDTTPVIMLVPEQYTFETEKRISKLFVGDDKDRFLRSRILSFKTMASIVFSQVGGLTDININSSGKAMMTYKAIESVSKELDVFSKATSQSGFVSSISEIISELKQYNIDPDMLENVANDIENEALKLKLRDISKIYKEFEEKLHENYVDSQDILNSLADKIEKCDYFNGAYIYIDEFTGFTPNQYRVLKALLKKAKEVNISLTLDNINKGNYNKADVFSRTKFTYERLVKICEEEGIKVLPSVNLNDGDIKRFRGNEELLHLEKYYNSYPYKTYDKETKNIQIKEFNNLYSEVEQIAKEIVSLVRDKNIRYKDITVATRDLNRYDFLVQSIFNEYNIPNFIDKKREAKSNPIVVLIISALEMKNRRYSYESMFRYLKSGLIGIDNDDISLLENYVLANGIKGKKWFEEKWNYRVNSNFSEDETELELQTKDRINEIKNRVIQPIEILQDKLKGRNKTVDICKYIYEFLLDINMPNTIEGLILNFKDKGELDIASQYSQVWNIVVDILDQMVEIMGDESISLDKFIKLISLGFDEYELGLVPPSIDQVLVSSVDRMKNTDTKYLYLIGTTDGIFPLISKDGGLLNDDDRKRLEKSGVEVDIDSKTKTFEEQFLVYKALTSTTENLIITYPISDYEGKTLRSSIIVSRLKKIFPNIKNTSYIVDEEIKTDEDILKKVTSKSPTFSELINNIKEFDNNNLSIDEINAIWLDLYRYYINDEEYKNIARKVIKGLSYTNQVQKLEENKIKSLYQGNLLSVSRLEKYAQCPFAYFIQYGLKAKERREYSFTAPDLGTFIHNILDKFSKELSKDNLDWRDINEDYIDKKIGMLVDEIVSKIPGYILNSSERYKYLAYRLKNMLVTAIKIISEQISQGSFEPKGYEVDFGIKGKYPPIKIILNNGEEINLVGKIDRVDELEEGEDKYIRIIDYKSGNKSISLTDIYYGLQLQLMVYLDAILESCTEGEINLKPAAILYCRIDDPIAKFSEDQEDDIVKESILKELRMKGLVIKDSHIIKEMDKSLENGERSSSLVIPANLTKDGKIGKNTSGVTYEEFDILRKYVKQTIKNLCEDMLGGNIMIAPYKNKNATSCDFCSYSVICQFDSSLKDNKYKILNNKENEEIINIMKEEIE